MHFPFQVLEAENLLKVALFYFGGVPIFRISKIWQIVLGKLFVNAKVQKKKFHFSFSSKNCHFFTCNLTFWVIFETIRQIRVGLTIRIFAEPSKTFKSASANDFKIWLFRHIVQFCVLPCKFRISMCYLIHRQKDTRKILEFMYTDSLNAYDFLQLDYKK